MPDRVSLDEKQFHKTNADYVTVKKTDLIDALKNLEGVKKALLNLLRKSK
jgi:hypothetical protein